jgi:high-affinity iron transporter
MIPSLLLSLREGVEAALIIGVVLGTLRKINRMDMSRAVWLGAGSAAIISLLVALLLQALGTAFKGRAEEIFEGITMVLAAGILTWMIFWMNRQALKIKSELESGVQQAAIMGGNQALFSLAFLAVLREGVELALFLTAASISTEGMQILIGAALGLSAAFLLGWLLFASTVRLNLQHFFKVTGILLILFAAGLFAHGIHEFNEAGLIPPVIEHIWDTNHILDENSSAGMFLKALFGYNGNPSLTEVIAYSGYLLAIGIGLRLSPYLRGLETEQPTQ